MPTITISVTQEHIDKGAGAKCLRCPVALAIAGRIPGSFPMVFYHVAVLRGFGIQTDAHFPDEVTHWITNFDTTGKGEPFEFELELPD